MGVTTELGVVVDADTGSDVAFIVGLGLGVAITASVGIGTASGADCTIGTGSDIGVGVGTGVGVGAGVGDTLGVGVVVGHAVGLTITVAVATGVPCFLAFLLEVPPVTGGGIPELPVSAPEDDEVDGGGVAAAVTTGETVGANTGVTVTMSDCAVATSFLLPVSFPTFETLCILLE
jgi:hypothetical protein